MRKPEYLSPSSLDCFEKSQDEFYFRYLCDVKLPKPQQTLPMSIGSAFDAYIKSHIHQKLFGKNHPDANKFDRKSLFEAQVEQHNRAWAWVEGEHVYNQYIESGALADLMLELESAAEDPRFEFEIKGEVEGYREGVTKRLKGMILLGKPDIRFVSSSGAHCIVDWKVNGYCSGYAQSPKPGYVMDRQVDKDGYWFRKGAHKDAFIQTHLGMKINTATYLENVERSWATQNATYGWLLGEPVGAEIVAGIDQICCNGAKRDINNRPSMRMVSHRCRVSEKFQFEILARYQFLWSLLNTEPFHFFYTLSLAESQEHCKTLDTMARTMVDKGGDELAQWAMQMARES